MISFLFGTLKHWWREDEFFINEMCIVVVEQNSGIGSKMMNDLIKELETDGVCMISLLTDREIPAKDFYKKHGFF